MRALGHNVEEAQEFVDRYFEGLPKVRRWISRVQSFAKENGYVRNLFGITEQDGPREARQKIAGELALLDDGWVLFDLGSTSGTLVNGRRIEEADE